MNHCLPEGKAKSSSNARQGEMQIFAPSTPRSGDLTLARLFKAGNDAFVQNRVASATLAPGDFQASLMRRDPAGVGVRALKDTAKLIAPLTRQKNESPFRLPQKSASHPARQDRWRGDQSTGSAKGNLPSDIPVR